MMLERHDGELFLRLHRALLAFVNQRLKVIPRKFATLEQFAVLSPEFQVKVRDALIAKLDLIESFVAENPVNLPEEALDIVRSWRHLVAGRFLVIRELKKHTVFLTAREPHVAYGVLALSRPFEDMIGPHLPVMAETVLLPFKDRIVYDGLMACYGISFGAGVRRLFNESFKEAKLQHGIVTSLPMSNNSVVPTKTPKRKPVPRREPP
jgi:hypothetical protein